MSDENLNDADFDAGFNDEPTAATTTPHAEVDQGAPAEESRSDQQQQITEQAKPEFVQLTKKERDDLMAKAALVDELRAEHGKKFDQTFGKIGGMQQLMDKLQAATQAGRQVTVSEEDFEELKAEGYGDLAQMTAAGLTRALAKMGLKGTGDDAPKFGEEQAKALFSQEGSALRQSLKDEIRGELAKESLNERHEDWVAVINSPEFATWRDKNKVGERKDRAGKPFAESENPKFVADVIDEFKATQKQSNARKDRLAAAVPPKGSGGLATSTNEEDEFSKGFNS